jgi:DNA-binding GntR family transcriptional regulator
LTKLFQPVKKGSVSLRVSDALREAIFSSKLRPGDPLLEAHLAEDFQVSQTSVREALLNLERFGLVRRVPNRGTFVTKLSPEELRERIAVRIPLEEMACIGAARRMTEDHFKELDERARVLSTAMSQNAYFDTSVAEFRFHHYIWEHNGNRVLCQTLDQLSAPLLTFVGIVESARGDRLNRAVAAAHQELASAIRGGKVEIIRDALKAHFHTFYEEFPHSSFAETGPPNRSDGVELQQPD